MSDMRACVRDTYQACDVDDPLRGDLVYLVVVRYRRLTLRTGAVRVAEDLVDGQWALVNQFVGL